MLNGVDHFGFNLVHYCILLNDLEMLNLLALNGASLNIPTGEIPARTPLVMAAELGHEQLVKILVRAGASIEIRDESQNSTKEAFDMAI